jgi:hypothetical protein
MIEATVNKQRFKAGRNPIRFLMTDIKPHIASWKGFAAMSPSLGFIYEPVDATNPPLHIFGRRPPSVRDGNDRLRIRTFRLYCLSFHHFDDEMARKVLRSTLDTSDAFAIIELQDRRLASFMLMLCNFFLLFLTSAVWFWRDPVHLALTYVIPIVPSIVAFDGLVSAARTREFDELMSLVDDVLGTTPQEKSAKPPRPRARRGEIPPAERGNWRFQGGREAHTMPFGYLNWFVGYRIDE